MLAGELYGALEGGSDMRFLQFGRSFEILAIGVALSIPAWGALIFQGIVASPGGARVEDLQFIRNSAVQHGPGDAGVPCLHRIERGLGLSDRRRHRAVCQLPTENAAARFASLTNRAALQAVTTNVGGNVGLWAYGRYKSVGPELSAETAPTPFEY